jgi:hypothetical protein
MLAEHYFFDIVRKSEYGKHDIGLLRHGLRRVCPNGTVSKQRLSFGAGPIVHGHGVAGRKQVAAHTRPHYAGADPAEACAIGSE